jgi:ferric-dicitrate binding protein FerR (iron transport regulator)
MSQTVAPPILPKGSPDRDINCEVALEAAFAALVTASEAQGWTPRETAAALLKIATEHAQPFNLVPAEPPRRQARSGMLIACAALLFLLCAAIGWWLLR